jgi:hypothetical protein
MRVRSPPRPVKFEGGGGSLRLVVGSFSRMLADECGQPRSQSHACEIQETYYSVTALQDGTVFFATQTRKPVRSNVRGKPQIDEDGIHNWYFEKQEVAQGFTDWERACTNQQLSIASTRSE